MDGYYSQRLSAERLLRVYEVAPPRVKRYLQAEIEFVLERIKPSDLVLELGCGYGRVLERFVGRVRTVIGIDTSHESLRLAQEKMRDRPFCYLLRMNAVQLGFHNQQFDIVACIQNGISAFKVDQRTLIGEAIRVTKPGGRVLFSSYSESFWEDRLEWFRIQADHGLIGEIDYDRTGDGIIVCKDGFEATTVGPNGFEALTSSFAIDPEITEVDGSSIFCEIRVRGQ